MKIIVHKGKLKVRDTAPKPGETWKENREGEKPFEIIRVTGNLVLGSNGSTYHASKIVKVKNATPESLARLNAKDAGPISQQNLDPAEVKKEKAQDKRILSQIESLRKQMSYYGIQNTKFLEQSIDKAFDVIDNR